MRTCEALQPAQLGLIEDAHEVRWSKSVHSGANLPTLPTRFGSRIIPLRARTNAISVISVLPRSPCSARSLLRERRGPPGPWDALKCRQSGYTATI